MPTQQLRHLFLGLFTTFCVASLSASTVIHVAPDGNDSNPGSHAKPFQTITRAQQAVRELKQQGTLTQPVAVLLQAGRYELSETLLFGPEDSGSKQCPITYHAADDANVTVSGGREIANWKCLDGNHWVAQLPEVKAGKWYFRQLFAGDTRLTRARTPNEGFYFTKGPLTKYADKKNKGYRAFPVTLEDGMTPALIPGDNWTHAEELGLYESRCGFQFKEGDVQLWDNWPEAEILTYHSWECSWQAIRTIDMEKQDIWLSSPSRYPVGRFGNRMRYRIENIPAALDQAGEWYLDGTKGQLHYLANPGENPNKMNIRAPYLKKIMGFAGDTKGNSVAHLRFEGITFRDGQCQFGIYDHSPDWPSEIRKYDPTFPENPRPGFTDAQSCPRAGQAIELVDTQHVTFEKCRFKHMGAYAMKLSDHARHIRIIGCEFFDLGAGAIVMGHPTRFVEKAGYTADQAPAYNEVADCWIHHTGSVHPSGNGIVVLQSHHNKVLHNEIHDIAYHGISHGWNWLRDKHLSDDCLYANNYIHHVARLLGDSAGIYTLGVHKNTIFRENWLDEIFKAKGAAGVVSAWGLDSKSTGFIFERNVIDRTQGLGFFHSHQRTRQIWIDNNFDVAFTYPKFKHSDKYEPDKFTLAAEIMLTNYLSDNQRGWIVGKNGNEQTKGHYSLIVIGDRPGVYMHVPGAQKNRILLVGDKPLRTGSSNAIAATFDGNMLRLYADGDLVGQKKIGKPRVKGKGSLIITKRPDSDSAAFEFKQGINHVRMWDRAMSGKDIAGLILGHKDEPEDGQIFAWDQTTKKAKSKIDFDAIRQKAGPRDPYKMFLGLKNRQERRRCAAKK